MSDRGCGRCPARADATGRRIDREDRAQLRAGAVAPADDEERAAERPRRRHGWSPSAGARAPHAAACRDRTRPRASSAPVPGVPPATSSAASDGGDGGVADGVRQMRRRRVRGRRAATRRSCPAAGRRRSRRRCRRCRRWPPPTHRRPGAAACPPSVGAPTARIRSLVVPEVAAAEEVGRARRASPRPRRARRPAGGRRTRVTRPAHREDVGDRDVGGC